MLEVVTHKEQSMAIELPPIQRKILLVLSDGQMHRKEELIRCLEDPEASPTNLASHLTMMRKELRHHGETVSSTRIDGEWWYQHVRLISARQ